MVLLTYKQQRLTRFIFHKFFCYWCCALGYLLLLLEHGWSLSLIFHRFLFYRWWSMGYLLIHDFYCYVGNKISYVSIICLFTLPIINGEEIISSFIYFSVSIICLFILPIVSEEEMIFSFIYFSSSDVAGHSCWYSSTFTDKGGKRSAYVSFISFFNSSKSIGKAVRPSASGCFCSNSPCMCKAVRPFTFLLFLLLLCLLVLTTTSRDSCRSKHSQIRCLYNLFSTKKRPADGGENALQT